MLITYITSAHIPLSTNYPHDCIQLHGRQGNVNYIWMAMYSANTQGFYFQKKEGVKCYREYLAFSETLTILRNMTCFQNLEKVYMCLGMCVCMISIIHLT